MVVNHIQLRANDKNKGASMCIDRRTKSSRNIAGFINNTQPRMTNKKPNRIFEGNEGNGVFICTIKSITIGE